MDAIDILGSLLGHKSGRSGRGTDILQDILRGGSRSAPDVRSSSSGPSAPNLQPGDIEREAARLEDLLHVANERDSRRRTGQPMPRQRQQPTRPEVGFPRDRAASGDRDIRSDAISTDQQALTLVRAMLNAAKSDGQIDETEQHSILQRLGDTSRETIQFLREEFAKPLDVREFAWNVPIGMEQQVYTMSLIAIDLDTRREAKYLLELAHGLRLSEDVREQIHRRLGAPSIR